MTDETTRIVAELRALAASKREGRLLPLVARRLADLMDALALALGNGGGCAECHGSGWLIEPVQQSYVGSKPVGWSRPGDPCPDCHGTGISDAFRPLLAACGLGVQ